MHASYAIALCASLALGLASCDADPPAPPSSVSANKLEKSDPAAAPLAEALALHASGQRDGAIAKLESALASGITSTDLMARLAAFHLEKESNLRAHELATRVIADDPDSRLALRCLAHLALRDGQHEIALVHARKSIRLDATPSPNDLELLGRIHLRVADLDAAESAFREALAIDSNHAPSLYGLGVVALRRGKMTAAEQRFVETLDRNPDFDEALFNLANVYRRSGKDEKARQAFAALARTKRAREEIEAGRAALASRPDDPDLLCELAAAYTRLGDVAAAAGAYQRAIAVTPGHRRALRELSSLAVRTGNASLALEIILAALERAPGDAEWSELARQLRAASQRE